MNPIEDQVRAATRAEASAMREVRPLRLPPEAAPRPAARSRFAARRPRRWRGWLAPVTAAAVVIALAISLVTIRDSSNGRVVPATQSGDRGSRPAEVLRDTVFPDWRTGDRQELRAERPAGWRRAHRQAAGDADAAPGQHLLRRYGGGRRRPDLRRRHRAARGHLQPRRCPYLVPAPTRARELGARPADQAIGASAGQRHRDRAVRVRSRACGGDRRRGRGAGGLRDRRHHVPAQAAGGAPASTRCRPGSCCAPGRPATNPCSAAGPACIPRTTRN